MPPDERPTTKGSTPRTNIASVTLMDDRLKTPPRKSCLRLILAFVAVALLGCFVRIYPSAKYTKLGFDEGLYGEYVVELMKHGVTGYPDLAEYYVTRQTELATVILPPTRF